jgi:hypothetical protein
MACGGTFTLVNRNPKTLFVTTSPFPNQIVRSAKATFVPSSFTSSRELLIENSARVPGMGVGVALGVRVGVTVGLGVTEGVNVALGVTSAVGVSSGKGGKQAANAKLNTTKHTNFLHTVGIVKLYQCSR